MSDRVNFQTTKFQNIDTDLSEMDEPTYGYRIWDNYGSEYNNFLSEEEVKAITPLKAKSFILDCDGTFYITMDNSDGFYFNGDWIQLDDIPSENENEDE